MLLSKNIKLEILQINLDCINEDLGNDSFIKVDNNTIDEWIYHLENLERYEDCLLIQQYRKYMQE